MAQPMASTIQCPYCAGAVPAHEVECPRCGAPLGESIQVSDFHELTVDEFIEESNQELVKTGTSAAELAFGVGCTLEALVGGLLMVIVFFVFTKTWTILAVIALIVVLISILVSSLLASRAQKATTRSTFEREIKPEINDFIASHDINQEQFSTKAAELLPADSPLLVYIAGQEN